MNKTGLRDIFIGIAAALSLLATLMTLMGYGVSLSMDQYGIAHETLFVSTLDLLDLSCWAVLFFFENPNKVSLWEEYVKLIPNFLPAVLILYILLVGSLAYARYRKKGRLRGHSAIRVLGWLKPAQRDPMPQLAFKTALYCAALALVFPALCIASAVSMILLCAALLTAPTIGYAAGNLHALEHVIKPEACAPTRSREHRLADAATAESQSKVEANCVVVSTERGLNKRGRVLLATTTAIVLFDPVSGGTARIPTKDAMIEPVDSLAPAAPETSAPAAGIAGRGAAGSSSE